MISSQHNTQVWPTVADYDKALQNAKATVYDLDIKNGKLDVDPTGPRYLNEAKAKGKYVCVYRVSNWVVRCFTGAPPSDIRERYLEINRYIYKNTKQLAFLVPHIWIDKGIKISGKEWPFIKLQYIEHNVPLGAFLQGRYEERITVSSLASQWYSIASTMESLSIAHGDLDVTNILICTPNTSPTMRLIDFDSMYVPALATPGRKLWEYGHEHFQPVEKNVRNFNKEMDRFSSLIIYLSLIALIEDPTLWESCRANEENKLLLGSGDFQRIGISPAYQLLRAKQGNETLQKCLDELVLSVQEKRMPRSLSEIVQSTRRSTVQRMYEPLPLPISLDIITQSATPENQMSFYSNSQSSFSGQSAPPSSRQEPDIPIILDDLSRGDPMTSSQIVPRKKSWSSFWLVFFVLIVTVFVALATSATAPGFWVVPAILLCVLIALAMQRPK